MQVHVSNRAGNCAVFLITSCESVPPPSSPQIPKDLYDRVSGKRTR